MSSGKLVLIFCFALFFEFCRTCPSVCVCKWKNGKQTVECDKRDLLAIPKGIDPGTQVLNFSGNNLQILKKEKFLKLELINLQRIYLSQCRISNIHEHTFKGLTNLVELDLSGNLLVSIPTETFIDCPSLMKLTLNFNPIKALRKAAFNHLSYLNTLEIGNCEISYIQDDAFKGLQSLEWLRLDNNKLTTLKCAQNLPKSLRGIELQGNMWECDCHIVKLHLWLQDFSIPHNMEPICNGPARLYDRSVRSVPPLELACLPDVSPTTFYLEIGEGRNVSLLCRVRAIPEAHVSWLFQGRVLQNDTLIAPGLHLMYFIEEGLEDKKSELFIYNTNVEDNGTFVCSAENSAGLIQSNFTLRVVIKEEPQSIAVATFSFEYLLILLSAAAVFAVMTVLVAIIYMIKCTASRNSSKKRRSSKMTTVSQSTKDSLLHDSTEEYTETLKENSNLIVVDRRYEMVMHTSSASEDILATPTAALNQLKSPTSLKRFQLEQNPDLINDTESVGRQRDGDGRDHSNRGSYGKAMENVITDFELYSSSRSHNQIESGPEFRPNNREFYSIPADVHLNPIGLLSKENLRPNFYRTLPHNRAGRQSPSSRYSREAEILSRNSPSASYEHYCPGVRYTADGYETCTEKSESPLQYSTASSESASKAAMFAPQPCCSPPVVQWPHCVPATLNKLSNCQQSASADLGKRCVSAQTDSESTKSNLENTKPINKSLFNVKVHEVLTESPDEGYEGESGESNSNPG